MSADPWFRFFPADWLSGTAGLSAAEKGVYITVVALMYDSGGPIRRDEGRLARQCGIPRASLTRAIDALIECGKISFDGQCLINSRVKSELTERENRICHAREGARVTNEKKSNKTACEPRPSEPIAHAQGTLRAGAQQPQSQSLEDKPLKTNARDARFDRFWSAWPNKVQKPYAQKCFAKVAGEVEAIVSGVDRYIREKPPDRPWLNPSTFLNQRRWEDAPAATFTAGGQNGSKRSLVDAGRDLVRRLGEPREPELPAASGGGSRDRALRLLSGFGGQ